MAAHLFDSNKKLTKADFQLLPWGALITIHWSKNIQFRERIVSIVEIPLPHIPNSTLCPTITTSNAFRFTSSIATQGLAGLRQGG